MFPCLGMPTLARADIHGPSYRADAFPATDHKSPIIELPTLLLPYTRPSDDLIRMSVPGPNTTPSRFSAVSPGRWIYGAFTSTPDSTRTRNGSRHILAMDHNVSMSSGTEDVLPIRFNRRCSGSPDLGCDPLPGDSSMGHASDPRLALMVPVKRKRKNRGGETLSLAGTGDGVAVIPGSSPELRTGKKRSRTRGTPATGGSDYNQDLPHLPTSPTRSRSRRVVFDAVEIVSKKRPGRRVVNSRTARNGCPTEDARCFPSSHYPSPPVSRARDVRGGNPHHIIEPEYASSEPPLPLKTSTYFSHVSATPTQSVPESIPVLTPPSSPIPAIPVQIESSDFDPPLDVSFDKPVEDLVDKPRYTSSWYNNPRLFDDLMIMLRRLKPILVQGM